MPYGSALVPYTIPTASSTVGPTYASNVSECLTTLKTVLEAAVTPSGMDINADLSFLSSGTYSNITNLKSAQLYANAAALDAGTFVRAVYSTGGELYYNDASGNQVQITDGGSVNAAASGSITGAGYGSGGVVVNWSSGDNGYQFKLGSGADDYADLLCDDLRLNDGSGNFITLQAPSISVNYAWTLPNALPASTSLLSVTTGGTVAYNRDPSVDTVTTTGAISAGTTLSAGTTITAGTGLTVTSGGATVTAGGLTVTAGNVAISSGTLSASGLITATSGLTAAANQHITVSGTGKFKFASQRRVICVAAGQVYGAATHVSTGYVDSNGVNGVFLMVPLDIEDGITVDAVSAQIDQIGGSDTTTMDFGYTENGSWTSVSSTTSSTGIGIVAITVSPGHIVDWNGPTPPSTSARYYGVRFTANRVAADVNVYGMTYTVTQT